MDSLGRLFHHRWAIPALAELHRAGAKFVTLRHRLGANHGALRAALDHLIDCDWVARNPGYGHPLRPEYLLTAQGAAVAAACARLWRLLQRLDLVATGLRKWPLRVALAAGAGGRFGEIKQRLPAITARALTMALKALEEAGAVDREVTADYPPRARYRLTREGRRIAAALAKLPGADRLTRRTASTVR